MVKEVVNVPCNERAKKWSGLFPSSDLPLPTSGSLYLYNIYEEIEIVSTGK